MKKYRIHFNNSFERAIVPNPNKFYRRFYEKLNAADPRIPKLFEKTDMERQILMLKQSMTYMMSFSATLEPSVEMEDIAKMHGKDRLDIPSEFFDIWLNCMLETVKEFDLKFDENIETSWRVMMAPGMEYVKSFVSH